MISDERLQRLLRVEVNEQTSVIDAEQAQQLSLGIDLNGNKGFEGLAYDTAGQRLYVAKERNPVRIYEISGFPFAEPTPSVHISEHQARLFVRDLSSLQFDEQTGHLLALSDESRLVVELDADGQPLSSLSLSAGRHGLSGTCRRRRDGDGTGRHALSGQRAEPVLRVSQTGQVIGRPADHLAPAIRRPARRFRPAGRRSGRGDGPSRSPARRCAGWRTSGSDR